MKKIVLLITLIFIMASAQEMKEANGVEISITFFVDQENKKSMAWREIMVAVNHFIDLQEAFEAEASKLPKDTDPFINDQLFQVIHRIVDYIGDFEGVSDQPIYGSVDATIGIYGSKEDKSLLHTYK